MADFMLNPEATPEEAAALIAAVERFLADTVVPSANEPDTVSGWLRAALQEGVGERDQHALW